MTSPSRLRYPAQPRRRPLREALRRAATVAVPLLAALAIAPTVPVRPPTSNDGLTEPPAASLPAAPARPLSTAPRADVQKIADVVAKRYRVSSQATVELVRTAYREANRNGVDPLLVLAVMAIESSFNPIAESDGGAVGLMQIVPRFHEDKLASRDGSALDPRVNIEVGTQLLREYIRRAGNEIAGLQLYNGSPDDPANAYANKVIGERERLRQAIKQAQPGRA